MRRIRYAVAMSLDGYALSPEDEADWVIKDPEGDGKAFVDQCDTVLIGRNTFEAAQERGGAGWAPEMRTYVFSRTLRQADLTNVTVVADQARERLTALKQETGKD